MQTPQTKTILRLSQEQALSAQRHQRMSPEKNRFLKDEWGPSKGFIEKLTQSKAHIDHTVTTQLTKYKSKIWDLQTEVETLKQLLGRINTENDQQKSSLGSQVAIYQQLLKKNQLQKSQMLLKRNQAVKLQISNILSGHQEAIIFYQMQKAEFERLLSSRDDRIRQLQLRLRNSQGAGKDFQQQGKQLREQLSHNNQVKEQLKDTIRLNNQNFQKEIKNLKDFYEDKIQNMNAQKVRTAFENSKDIQNLKNIAKLDKENQAQNYDNKISTLQNSYSAKIHDLEGLIAKNEDDIRHSLMQIDNKQKEIVMLRSQLAHLNNTVQKRSSQLISLDKDYKNLLRDCDLSIKDKLVFKSQLDRISNQNIRLLNANELFAQETDKLKEVLIESSQEMERCRDELIKGERDKEILRLERDEAQLKQNKLQRMLAQREKEVQRWRDNYYTLRNKL